MASEYYVLSFLMSLVHSRLRTSRTSCYWRLHKFRQDGCLHGLRAATRQLYVPYPVGTCHLNNPIWRCYCVHAAPIELRLNDSGLWRCYYWRGELASMQDVEYLLHDKILAIMWSLLWYFSRLWMVTVDCKYTVIYGFGTLYILPVCQASFRLDAFMKVCSHHMAKFIQGLISYRGSSVSTHRKRSVEVAVHAILIASFHFKRSKATASYNFCVDVISTMGKRQNNSFIQLLA